MPGPKRTFGLVPHVNDDGTWAALGELCTLLSNASGLLVLPHFAGSAAALASSIETAQVDFAWVSPTLLLLSEHLSTAVPLLTSVRQGVAFFHSVLFVPAVSRIGSVEDLAGKSVGWVARTSASGYIVPRLDLVRRGIDVRTFFGRQVLCDSHAAVAWKVHRGEVEVGATYAVFEEGNPGRTLVKSGFLDFVPELDARIIDVAGPIPSDMIIADPRVPIEERAAFASTLATLAADPASARYIKKVMGVDQFRSISHEAVRELADLIATGRRMGALESS